MSDPVDPAWQRRHDTQREADVFFLDVEGGGRFCVSESGVGEWRWVLSNADGDALAFARVDHLTSVAAMKAAELYAATGEQ